VIVDNGSAHRGKRSIDRLQGAWKNLTLLHTPIHASWLNQAEIYLGVTQREVLQPNNFTDLAELERTLLAFARHYEQIAQPFKWKFTRADLSTNSLALVLLLDPQPGRCRLGRVDALARLDRGLLVRRRPPRRRAQAARPASGPRRSRGSGPPVRQNAGRAGRSRSGSSTGGSRPRPASNQTVMPETCATIPRWGAARAISAADPRDSGTPELRRKLARQRLDLMGNAPGLKRRWVGA
jgi:hypothetical protein